MAASLIVLAALMLGQQAGPSAAPPVNNWFNVQRGESVTREFGWIDTAGYFHASTDPVGIPQTRVDDQGDYMGALGADGVRNFGLDVDKLKGDGVGNLYTSKAASAAVEAIAREIAGGSGADGGNCRPIAPVNDFFGIKADLNEIAVYVIAGFFILSTLFLLSILAIWGLIRWLR